MDYMRLGLLGLILSGLSWFSLVNKGLQHEMCGYPSPSHRTHSLAGLRCCQRLCSGPVFAILLSYPVKCVTMWSLQQSWLFISCLSWSIFKSWSSNEEERVPRRWFWEWWSVRVMAGGRAECAVCSLCFTNMNLLLPCPPMVLQPLRFSVTTAAFRTLTLTHFFWPLSISLCLLSHCPLLFKSIVSFIWPVAFLHNQCTSCDNSSLCGSICSLLLYIKISEKRSNVLLHSRPSKY